MADGPPAGAIIQGARNWSDVLDDTDTEMQFDLEEVGVKEALKPTPPAYGVYRGSVRIADSDIRYSSFVIPSLTFSRWVVTRVGPATPTPAPPVETTLCPPSYPAAVAIEQHV